MKTLLICALLAAACIMPSSAMMNRPRSTMCNGAKRFTVKLDGQWSSTNHPFQQADRQEFQKVLVFSSTHNGIPSSLVSGSPSPGLEQFASSASVSAIIDELIAMGMTGAIGHWTWSAASFPGHGSSAELTILVDPMHPFITVLSKLSQSSGWYVAATVNACNTRSGKWKTDMDDVALVPYKAVDPIQMIKCGEAFCSGNGGPVSPPLGFMYLEQQCEGVQRYAVRYDSTWSMRTHPLNYPGAAHFSPPVGAAHSPETYPMFQVGEMSSPGLDQLSQTGGTDIMASELKTKVRDRDILSMDVCQTPFDAVGTSDWMFLYVDGSNPYISYATMIAPSPDHFTGVRTNMCSKGSWMKLARVEAGAWDSGSAGGPRKPIAPLECDSKYYCNTGSSIAPFGSVYFENLSQPCGMFSRRTCPKTRCVFRMRKCRNRRMMMRSG